MSHSLFEGGTYSPILEKSGADGTFEYFCDGIKVAGACFGRFGCIGRAFCRRVMTKIPLRMTTIPAKTHTSRFSGRATPSSFSLDWMIVSSSCSKTGGCQTVYVTDHFTSMKPTIVFLGDASAEEDYVLGAMGWASTKKLPLST